MMWHDVFLFSTQKSCFFKTSLGRPWKIHVLKKEEKTVDPLDYWVNHLAELTKDHPVQVFFVILSCKFFLWPEVCLCIPLGHCTVSRLGRIRGYFCWTKSCTTKDNDYPIIYRVLTIPGGQVVQDFVHQQYFWLVVLGFSCETTTVSCQWTTSRRSYLIPSKLTEPQNGGGCFRWVSFWFRDYFQVPR